MSSKHALILLIIASALLRLLAAGVLGLGNDEAYHFLYAVHPAFSYYDHPPMLAWIESVGLNLLSSPFSILALRGLHHPFCRFHGPDVAGRGALVRPSCRLPRRVRAQCHGLLRAGRLDLCPARRTPLVLLAAHAGPPQPRDGAAVQDMALDRGRPGVGRLAMLSKYHAVFLPAGMVLLLLLHRPLRHWLFRPGPYIAAGLGCLVFSPVLVWNASHHWASFLFQGGRAVGGLVPHPDYLATALLAQAGYLLPWIWIPLVVLLYQHVRNWNRLGNDHERLALCLSVLPVAAFTGVACFRPVLPHWGLIGLVSLLPALGDSWSKQLDRHHARALRGLCFAAVFPVLLMGLTIIEHRTGWLRRGGPAMGPVRGPQRSHGGSLRLGPRGRAP